jgi:hypothetical protein
MLKAGDIIQWNWNHSKSKWYVKLVARLQMLFDRTLAQHTSLYIGNNTIMEMNTKLEFRKASNLENRDYVEILRLKGSEIYQDDVDRAVKRYLAYLGDDIDYPFHELIQVGLHTFLQKLIKTDVDIPIIKNNKASICSAMVSDVYKLIGINLTKSSNPSPGKLERSKLLTIIKPFGKGVWK